MAHSTLASGYTQLFILHFRKQRSSIYSNTVVCVKKNNNLSKKYIYILHRLDSGNKQTKTQINKVSSVLGNEKKTNELSDCAIDRDYQKLLGSLYLKREEKIEVTYL